MLAAIAIILAVFWLFGLITAYTLSGFIHVLLLLAIVSLVFHFLRGRRPVYRP